MTINERKSLPIWKKILTILFSIIIFAIQLGFIISFFILYSNFNKELYHGIIGTLYSIFEILGVVVCLFIIYKPISTNYKLVWCFLILLFPLPFSTIYFINDRSRKMPKKKKKKINKFFKNTRKEIKNDVLILDDKARGLAHVLQYSTYAPAFDDTKFIFFKDARLKHIDMLSEIKKAKQYVLLEYFIIADGRLMNDLFEVLNQIGKNGVKIFILYDDVGSKSIMAKKLVDKLKNIPNLIINNFEPLGLNVNLLVNYRDHRKICVIDGNIAYCGGDNLADEYIHEKERFGYWRDNCGKYIGKAAKTFELIFQEGWYLSTKETLELPSVNYDSFSNEGYIVPFGDGPSSDLNPAYDLFKSLVMISTKYLYISTPYFIIDDDMINTIALKAKMGVDVILLMPGIPDKKAPFYIARYNYKKLVAAGVKIYEFNGFNHAKNIIVDDNYAFIGTVNMDYRSLFLHYECGALVIQNKEIYKMKEDYINSLSNSKLIGYKDIKKRPLIQKIIAFVLNIFSPFF